MASKALISRRRARTPAGDSSHPASSSPDAALEKAAPIDEQLPSVAEELSREPNAAVVVERETTAGAIVQVVEGGEAEGDPLADLEAQGFRVKRLPETNLIRVGAFSIDVEGGGESEDVAGQELSIPDELAADWPHHLVQLIGPPTPEWIARIEEQGVDVAEPISRYALFVCASPERVAALRGLKMPDDPPGMASFVVWTGPFEPAYRIAPELFGLNEPRLRYVNISVYPETQAEGVAAAVEGMGGAVVEHWGQEGRYRDRFGFLIAELDAGRVADVARLPYVRSIEYHAPSMSAEDERAAQIVAESLDGVASAPVPGYQETLARFELDGRGVVIGICDSGVDTNDDATLHPDLRGRLDFFIDVTGGVTPRDVKGHGTHVAGIAAGSGASGEVEPGGWVLGQGVAPGARLGSVNPVDTLGGPGTAPVGRFTRIMLEHGAHVMNNSWKQGGSSFYTANAALVDRLVRDPNADNLAAANDYLVLVFSAGNEGPGAGTLTEPKAAKNPIVVGNSLNWRRDDDDIRGVSRTSSRGPTADGRLAPTVVAPGTNIVSARSSVPVNGSRPLREFRDDAGAVHLDHALNSGTSMAAPQVAGLCALLIQWHHGRSGGNPSPALLKALLVNGAEDIAGGPDGRGGTLAPIPNNDQGWGRVSLTNIVADAPLSDRGPKLLFDQERPFRQLGEEHLYVVRPADALRALRITLVWTDPPGAVNASPALVNDLDLEVVESGTNRVFRGNVFSDGFSEPGGEFDDLNNVECVYIRQPADAGVYEIRVVAQTLTAAALPPFTGLAFQDYALVIDNAILVSADS